MLSITKISVSKRRIKMIFISSMMLAAISFLWAIMTYFLGITKLGLFLFITSMLFLITAFLAKNRFPAIARISFLLLFNTSVTYVSSYLGKDASVDFFLFFAVGLPFMLFSFKREKIILYVFCLIPFLFWLLLYLTDFKYFSDEILTDSIRVRKIVYNVSITVTLLLVVFQLIYYSYSNAKVNTTEHSSKQTAIDASNAKSQFLSTMSHEIRTPLNAVIGLSHILGDNEPREDQKQNIEALNYSGKILLNLLNNVLDFSKMQSTSIELDNIPTDISTDIKQIEKIHKAACIRKGISLKLEIDDNIPFVWLDLVRFNQVINNLISNAIKFTDKGQVSLIIKKKKQVKETVTLHIEVKDTGIGILKNKQKTIWKAFAQASNTTNRIYGGTGLGLPIVKSIVTVMGSKVKLISRKNKGSRFYFALTLKIASNEDVGITSEKKEHNFIGKKVLLVDDNLINVMVGKQILEKSNLKVDVANDGLAALNLVKENTYDIVLMDIQMPIMDGYTATSEIRKFNTELPILALSANVFMEIKDKIEECGMDGFIFKPFTPEDLLNQIEQFTTN